MATEIERKFLVAHTDMLTDANGEYLSQGYLSHTPEAVVRVRIRGDQGFLTVKGISTGASRLEFEYPVPREDASQMLELCPEGRIEKTRYEIQQGKHIWEVDRFHGDNDGLIVAEIELTNENEEFEKPDWIGEEVTGDARYYNSSLSQHPYKKW